MSVLAVCRDLFFTSRIGQTGKLVGTPVEFVQHPGQLPSKLGAARPNLAIVDLTTQGWGVALRPMRPLGRLRLSAVIPAGSDPALFGPADEPRGPVRKFGIPLSNFPFRSSSFRF